MHCRPGCGACCIAPSISSPIPGMPLGKAAGEKCIQLDSALRCKIFGHPERPDVCGSLQPEPTMCGDNREHAMHWIAVLESATTPV
ncbi:YkgJ family cysteine cluster protein [Robbsia sp. KACC 23696]|uniref:YkgJ family cysteine cluster protein n=1 Tax=Robbsia sp. KACC 23696 TaxID=3149231 RepID=UPI00325BA380